MERLVYLIYADDSGSTGHNLKDKQAPFQIICALIIHDLQFRLIEPVFNAFSWIDHAPDKVPADFEFHAHHLFHGTGPFSLWEQHKRMAAFISYMQMINHYNIPVMYGGVNKEKLSKTIFRSGQPSRYIVSPVYRGCGAVVF
jgi:hypothetical protein